MLKDIVEALTAYNTALEVADHLRSTHLLQENADPARYAFGEILFRSELSLEAFVAIMELVEADRKAKLAPKKRQTEGQKIDQADLNKNKRDDLIARALVLARTNYAEQVATSPAVYTNDAPEL